MLTRLLRIYLPSVSLLLLITLALLASVRLISSASATDEGVYASVGDEIVVRYTAGAALTQRDALLRQFNLQKMRDLPQLGVSILKVLGGRATSAALSDLKGSSLVAAAEPNYLAITQEATPDDPLYPQQWGLRAIGAPGAWAIQTGSASVVIAVVDTGVDTRHPDLSNKIVAGWNIVANNGVTDDDNGHGTHVAGIAAAESNNGQGVTGVSWGARIMPVKVLDASGSGSYASVAEGIVYAVDHGARVINLSLGGPAPSFVLEDAVNYAYSHGAVVVAAAGNLGSAGVIYPARYANAIAVSAVDEQLNLAPFSSYGTKVDVAAPGKAITSTFLAGAFRSMSGTSMAAPHVAGAAALLFSMPQFDTPDKVRAALEQTTRDLGSPGKDEQFGNGLLQIQNAVFFGGNASSSPTPTGRAGVTPTASATALSTPTPIGSVSPSPTVPATGGSEIILTDGVGLFAINASTGNRTDLGSGQVVPREFMLTVPDMIGSLQELSPALQLTNGYSFLHALISPDKTEAVYVEMADEGANQKMWLVNLRTLDRRQVPSAPQESTVTGLMQPVAWSTRGFIYFEEYLLVGPQSRIGLWRLDVARQEWRRISQGSFPPHDLVSVASPDNQFIIVVEVAGVSARVAVFDDSTEQLTTLAELPSAPSALLGWTLSTNLNLIRDLPDERKHPPLPAYVATSPFLYWPLPDDYRNVQCRFGDYILCGGSGTHYGNDVDVSTAGDTPVYAAAPGTVIDRYSECGDGANRRTADGMGNFVKINHGNSYTTIYMHMAYHGVAVQIGDHVEAGTFIGYASNSGNTRGSDVIGADGLGSWYHLHFQVNPNLTAVNPFTTGLFVGGPDRPFVAPAPITLWACPSNTCCVNGGPVAFNRTGRFNLPSYLNNRATAIYIAPGWHAIVYDPPLGQSTLSRRAIWNSTDDLFCCTYDNGGSLKNSISSIEVFWDLGCMPTVPDDAGVTSSAGAQGCDTPPGPGPTPTPTKTPQPGVIDGLRLTYVSAPTVSRNQTFNVNVTYQIVSGQLLESRGDHLYDPNDPNSNGYVYGAYFIQPVRGSHNAGTSYTFSFNMTAPNQTGTFQTHWRMRVGGNFVGQEAVVTFTVQDEPSPPGGGGAGVYIYDNTNYSSGGGYYTGPILSGNYNLDGFWNDNVESIRVVGCYSYVLYWDSNFGGEHIASGGTTDLGDHWRNQASSIRIRSCDNPAFTIYSMGDYNGESWASDVTIYDLGHWEKNDWAESIRIASGKGIIACEHADFHGQCGRATGTREFSDINALSQGLRHGLSSVRVCDGPCPDAPSAAISYPVMDGYTSSNKDTILQWTGEGTSYYVELWGGALGSTRQFGWAGAWEWNVGQLPASANPYHWHVRAWNGYGEGGWAEGQFYVRAPTVALLGVFTTDAGLLPSSSSARPSLRSSESKSSAVQTNFGAGETIAFYLVVNNDFMVATSASFEVGVEDPAGRIVPSLSASGSFAFPPGVFDGYLLGIVPVDAITGDYMYTALITYNGQTTNLSTTFHVTGPPTVQAIGVFTSDEGGVAGASGKGPYSDAHPVKTNSLKTSFNAGDPIYLYIDTYNNMSQDATATFDWSVSDPFGRPVPELSATAVLTTTQGRVWWYLASSLPTDIVSGAYTFVGTIVYDGLTTSASMSFQVSAPSVFEVVEVFTTDDLGTAGLDSKWPRRQMGDVKTSAGKTEFNAGDPIRLYLGTYNDFSSAQQGHYEWLVLDSLGNPVSAMSWSGELTGATGWERWYMSSVIPADAYTGEYLFLGFVTHDGQTTGMASSFRVTGAPIIDVLNVFTTDESGTSTSAIRVPKKDSKEAKASAVKTSFNAGDPIRLYIDMFNNVPQDTAATFDWSVLDPFGQTVPELSWTGALTTPVENVWWYLSSAIPPNAITGDYLFTGSITFSGRTSADSMTLHVEGRLPSLSIALQERWNLISLRLSPPSAAITDVLSSVAGHYDLVYAYDAFDTVDPWKVYDTAARPEFNTLSVVTESLGLWVRTTDPMTLTVTGTVPLSYSIPLTVGWNLVGYPSVVTEPITVALSSIAGKYDLVYAYHAFDTADPWKVYDTLARPEFNTLTDMAPGWGYWIRVTEACVWRPD